ncbi:MAG: zinc ABC transporter substrate-binding protein [Caldilineaceae bacterium]|nr:zinc ABC transporter substrate-binding protein [Caldilineaceae bacterium]
MYTYLSRLLILTLLLLSVAACGGNSSSNGDSTAPLNNADDGPLRVVATIGQIADIAQIVGGDYVRVVGLMGPGIDPHLYVASEGDVDLLQQADIIFYNGLFLEAQMAEVLEQLGQRKTVTAVAERINPEDLLDWAQYADQYDPHVWFDVKLWMQAVEAVRDTYIEVDPDHSAEYQANTDAYLAELEELNAYVLEQAARVPAEKRVLITAHDAFHYFGRAYGFEVRGLQGISTATEAGTADVRALADFIVERQIPAIFVETSVPVRNIEALQAAVASQGYEVKIGGHLFSDAMGDAESGGNTYILMVRHNIDTIVGALLGES